MNYQITCFCGNRFLITDQQLSGPVNCPACKRPLQPIVSEHPIPATPTPEPTPATPVSTVSTDPEATKRCPFCGEVILAVAKKCKHCGEFLDRTAPHQETAPATASSIANDPVFSLHVSQWENFWKFVICATIVALVAITLIGVKSLHEYAPIGICSALAIMGLVAWLLYLSVKSSRCYIRPTRIDTEVGVISKDLSSLELFRITDMELRQGIVQRLLGIGTIRITSTDPNTPEMILYQIPQARKVHKYLQDQIPVATRQRGAIFMQK